MQYKRRDKGRYNTPGRRGVLWHAACCFQASEQTAADSRPQVSLPRSAAPPTQTQRLARQLHVEQVACVGRICCYMQEHAHSCTAFGSLRGVPWLWDYVQVTVNATVHVFVYVHWSASYVHSSIAVYAYSRVSCLYAFPKKVCAFLPGTADSSPAQELCCKWCCRCQAAHTTT